ncbi:aminodeoxychorismate lyase [Helicobacter muridarum]|uniref:Endolytic murein transglycosylase n=2 Tax=Helicobacter muridarum TaxID=216 RepID=A0A377PSY4_9HELI|nr:aminodeoxychorismate lyase [Helicobacter muridarum]STQ85579.1 aminodeoxychorismate lyase [Helicobacter muridarum]
MIPIKSERIIFIPKGSTKNIITHLQSKGYELSLYDAYLLHFIGKPQSGWIEIPPRYIDHEFSNLDTKDSINFDISLSKIRFLQALTTAKAATKSFTLIPGETSYFLLRNIASTFNLDVSKLESIYERLSPYSDGVILADTYSIPYQANEEFIISYLLQTSLHRHEELASELLGRYIQDEWFKYISKASIIQKEAANLEEMPLISSVIDNRIAINMPLQMDGSLNYGKYSHIRVTPDRIRNDTSEFNTYKYTGIPKTPSGSVSINAIKAAISPANTNYLYFMRNKNGSHDFTHDYQEHLRNISKVKN